VAARELNAEEFLRSRSPARAGTYARLLRDLAAWLHPRDLANANADALRAFLAARVEGGSHPNTVRKWLVMLRSYYSWAYERGAVTPATLLAIRAIRPPPGSSGRTQPQPYSRKEIAALWNALDERWPTLPPDEAARWIGRWADGKSPYARVRAHGIRLQLEAVSALALRCGLRRHEIRALGVDWMHYDLTGVVVWPTGVPWDGEAREVPYTDTARRAIRHWIEFRAIVRPDHNSPWLNLWSADTIRQPLRPDTFDKLLRTYVGEGWTLKRLRDTCAVSWVKAGLPLEHLRQILGLASLNDVLPYVALAGGSVERRMQRLDRRSLSWSVRSSLPPSDSSERGWESQIRTREGSSPMPLGSLLSAPRQAVRLEPCMSSSQPIRHAERTRSRRGPK
jgi:site-specific recombinase XerD